MTEEMTSWRDGEECILDSDVWRVAKNLTPMSAEEELEAWRQAVDVLRNFGKLAETLRNDPLILATTDALYRAEEGLARAKDRTLRPGVPGELTKREEDTLDYLLKRANAFSNAWALYSEHSTHPGREKELEILDELRRDTDEQFTRYKLEVGLEE